MRFWQRPAGARAFEPPNIKMSQHAAQHQPAPPSQAPAPVVHPNSGLQPQHYRCSALQVEIANCIRLGYSPSLIAELCLRQGASAEVVRNCLVALLANQLPQEYQPQPAVAQLPAQPQPLATATQPNNKLAHQAPVPPGSTSALAAAPNPNPSAVVGIKGCNGTSTNKAGSAQAKAPSPKGITKALEKELQLQLATYVDRNKNGRRWPTLKDLCEEAARLARAAGQRFATVDGRPTERWIIKLMTSSGVSLSYTAPGGLRMKSTPTPGRKRPAERDAAEDAELAGDSPKTKVEAGAGAAAGLAMAEQQLAAAPATVQRLTESISCRKVCAWRQPPMATYD